MNDTEPPWLIWARELQAIAQTGLTHTEGMFDRERYQRLREIAAEILQRGSREDLSTIREALQMQGGYATPKVDVRGAIVEDGRILLVQDWSDERWCMPGGWADVGDLPSAMVAREVLEESGLEVRPTKLVGVYDANRRGRPLEFFHAYKLVFLCERLGGELRTSHETLAVAFFPFQELPPLSTMRTDSRHLADVLRASENPRVATVFD